MDPKPGDEGVALALGPPSPSEAVRSGYLRTREALVRRRHDLWRVGTAVGVVLFLVRLLGEPWSTKFPPVYPDTHSYLSIAKVGPLHARFYTGERPMLYPLFIWSLGRNIRLIVLVQALLYVAAWGVLVRVAWQRLRRPIGAIAVACLVAIAVQSRFAFWTTELLSESLSFTLSILVTALWWRAIANRLVSGVWPAVIATSGWVSVRDTNAANALAAVALGAAIAFGFGWKLARPERRRLVAAMLVCVAVSLACVVSSSVGHRTRYGFYDVVGMRVLPDASLTKWFVDAGMPVNDTLRGRIGRDSWADDEVFLRSPDLEAFRDWAAGPGQRRFITSLALRAPDWLDLFYDAMPSMIGSGVDSYDNHEVRSRLPSDGIVRLVSPRSPTTFLFLLYGSAAAIVAALLVVRRRQAVLIFVGVVLLASVGDWYLSFVGDAVEYQRHSIGAVLRVNIMVVVAFAVAVDHFLRARGRDGLEPALAPDDDSVSDAAAELLPTATSLAVGAS